MKRNFGEGLIPLVLGLLSVALLCWDNIFIPWYEKKYEGKEEMASGPVMKIFNWVLRIIGLGIVLGVFGWLIYDIFFQGEEVKASVLIDLSFTSVIYIAGLDNKRSKYHLGLGKAHCRPMRTRERLKILLV